MWAHACDVRQQVWQSGPSDDVKWHGSMAGKRERGGQLKAAGLDGLLAVFGLRIIVGLLHQTVVSAASSCTASNISLCTLECKQQGP